MMMWSVVRHACCRSNGKTSREHRRRSSPARETHFSGEDPGIFAKSRTFLNEMTLKAQSLSSISVPASRNSWFSSAICRIALPCVEVRGVQAALEYAPRQQSSG